MPAWMSWMLWHLYCCAYAAIPQHGVSRDSPDCGHEHKALWPSLCMWYSRWCWARRLRATLFALNSCALPGLYWNILAFSRAFCAKTWLFQCLAMSAQALCLMLCMSVLRVLTKGLPFSLSTFVHHLSQPERLGIIIWRLYCTSLAVCAETWLFQRLAWLLPWRPKAGVK